ncbi:phage tail family protein [Clostridium felsineum]|uniref:phage tail family protein n=1 Tax=Clostridium felsineum TaxID=36839 RepID=UPI00214D35E2|nr:phage tail family protein [Clostridium felsineum]MCR3758149.1 phage tail family protein [Clostridium felsineum]
MQKIVFTNSKGQSIELSSSTNFMISKLSGTGSPQVSIQTTTAPYQDGTTVEDVFLKEREISIDGYIKGNTQKEIYERRQQLCSIFNPKLKKGQLKYINDNGEKIIDCYPEQAPVLGEQKTKHWHEFIVTLFCANPFWLDTDYKLEEIAVWLGGATFSCKFPISFAKKGDTKKNIINLGDALAPVEITFKGPATNPCITNLTTGEFVKVNRNLTEDDTLIINTEFGNKRVEIVDKNNNRINVFNWIDLNSTFWQLQMGDNIINYSSDNGVEPASVFLKYNNRYVGV